MRFEDWPKRLDEFTRAAMGRPFVWGEHDCALACAGAVESMTGIDFAKDYRGYSDKRGAYKSLLKVCGGGLDSAATKAFGPPLDSPLMAQRGDVCLVETDEGDALGWCVGAKIACAGPDGLTFLSLTAIKLAWRV